MNMEPIRRLQILRQPRKILVPEEGRIVPVTTELIEECMGWENIANDRVLSRRRMAWLFESVQTVGIPFRWHCARLAGKYYRLNGNHSLTLFFERPNLIREGMKADIYTYKCIDETELRTIWGAYDARPSNRSVSEINNTFRGGHPRLAQHSASFINLCATGIRMSKVDLLQSKPMTSVDQGELLYSSLDFIDAVAEVMGTKCPTTTHLWRAPVVYAMHKTYESDVTGFQAFWPLVRDGDSNRGSVPDLLRDYLIRTTLGSSKIPGIRADSRAIMCEKCIRMWNSWRTQKSLKKMVPHNGNIPKVL